MAPVMTPAELNAFLTRAFAQVADQFHVEAVDDGGVTIRLRVGEIHLRPGGTVSGPSIFSLADVAMYVATLARIGPKALAVTTNCSIDFMRKPAAATDLIARAVVNKLGRQLSVGSVLVWSEGDDRPVAQANLTYAIPPQGSAADVDV